MLNSALETPIFLDVSRHFWAANRRQGSFDLVTAALGSVMGARPIGCRRSRGEDGRPLRLRTPAIRCDRPTVQGPPAFSPAQCPRAGCQLILPQRTISCDAKDHARPRKYMEQNTFSKRGVQVEHEVIGPARHAGLLRPGPVLGEPLVDEG